MNLAKLPCALLLLMSMVSSAGAAVVNSANVNGLKTFTDTTTNRVWLDMDNFFDASANSGGTGQDMIAIAQAAGFAIASKDDVSALLGTLPLDAGQWAGYAAVMGYGAPRQLIWGMYDDGASNPAYGWAYAFITYPAWGFADDVYDASTQVNPGIPNARDLGLFAFQVPANSVPEPGSIALLTLSLAGLLAARHRKMLA
jgi:hypothetical protein